VVNNGPLPPIYSHTPYCSFTNSSAGTDCTDVGHQQVLEVSVPELPPYSRQDVEVAMEALVEEELMEQNRIIVAESIEEVRTGK